MEYLGCHYFVLSTGCSTGYLSLGFLGVIGFVLSISGSIGCFKWDVLQVLGLVFIGWTLGVLDMFCFVYF